MSSLNFQDHDAIYELVEAYTQKGLNATFYGGLYDAELIVWDDRNKVIAGATVKTLEDAQTFLETHLQQQRANKRYGSHRE